MDPTPPAPPSRPGAIILCGGESRRMGRPKAWLPFGPETLLPRVARQVSRQAGPLVVVAAPGQELPPLPPDIQIARDAVVGRGPLQGLAAGLAALPDDVEFVFARAVDAPFLAAGWVEFLADRITDHDLAIPSVAGRHQPLAALYRRSPTLSAIEELLRSDRLRATGLAQTMRTRVILEAELRAVDPELRTLDNINTLEEYERAIRTSTSWNSADPSGLD